MPHFDIPAPPRSAKDAVAIQNEMRARLALHDDYGELRLIAGVDVGFDTQRDMCKAAVVMLRFPDMEIVDQTSVLYAAGFPYVPGLLSFREAPAIMAALNDLAEMPDLLMVDGHGIAHPRRLGVAAHIGLLTGLPSVGVAKSVLCGTYEMPGPERGAQSPLRHKGEIIGTALRSRSFIKPVFVSPGHRVSQEGAVRITLQCLGRYRLPEPTRLADKLSKAGAAQL